MPNIVKNTTFPSLLDLLAPHSCRGCNHTGNILCNRCKKYILENHHNICPNCKQLKTSPSCPNCPELPPTYIIGKRSELIGNLVQDLKYHSARAAAPAIAELLDDLLPNIENSAAVIPLPTIPKHIRARALDHTLIIAKHFSKLRPDIHIEPALIRAKNTVQVGSDSKTRRLQANQAYSISPNFKPDSNTTYILLDDVWTTGASMQSAYQKLRQVGTKNIIIAIIALSE